MKTLETFDFAAADAVNATQVHIHDRCQITARGEAARLTYCVHAGASVMSVTFTRLHASRLNARNTH